MARVVRHLSVLIVAIVIGLMALPSAAAESDPSGPITVTLPSGVSLPPGSYDAVVTGSGQQIQAKIVVGTAPTGQSGQTGQPDQPGQPGSEQTGGGGVIGIVIAVLATVVLIVAGVLVYLKVLVPRRHSRSYREVLGMVAAGEYRRALPALTQVEAKLPEKLRAEARFFIAFALFQLDDLDEAEHRLAALNRENAKDVNVAYLLAYLRTTRRDYDGAEPVLEVIASAGQLGEGRVRKLYGIVKFQQALEALRDGRIDAAAKLFEKVEQLGDFGDQIPTDLRNRHVVLGAQALFDKDVVGARRQFENLEQAAAQLDPDQRESMTASAKLGLALAAWIEDAPGSPSKVESLLVDAAKRLDPDGHLELTWPRTADGTSIADHLEALTRKASRSAQDAELDRALRDVHFLRGVAVLRSWANAEQPSDAHLTEALSRFACARDRDPDFSDTYLVVGLLRYYLATTDQEREHGIAELRQAQKLGAHDPEVLQILNHHERIGRASRDAVDTYLQVLDRYVQDGSVREQVRSALVRRLSRYRKVRDWDSRPELTLVRAVAPTVAEMNDRSELLRERVNQLLSTQQEADDLAAARQLTHSLENDAHALSEHARSIEQKEAELLVLVGDRLLADNER